MCVKCAAGTYSSFAAASICNSCPSGYISNAGATNCYACGAGSIYVYLFFFFVVLIITSVFETRVAFESNSNTQCTECAAGTFSSEQGASVCTSCPAGFFSSGIGATICTACPAGCIFSFCLLFMSFYLSYLTYEAVAESQGSSTCTQCPAGFYAPTEGSSKCLPCAAGSANPLIGAISCQFCSAGCIFNIFLFSFSFCLFIFFSLLN